MDIDPLQDTVPPRYAIESDEEEDEENPLRLAAKEDTSVEIKLVGDIPAQKNIVVASGDAGKIWAKGADLGEQTGAVSANGVQMGLVFNPPWTKSTIIVSESFSRLPLNAMHPYAEYIIQSLKPQSVALLDTYPLPTYATDTPLPLENAPLRYLSTSSDTSAIDTSAQPFSPPNLIQSTSASFLSILAIGSVISTLILLPSPNIPSPRPNQIPPSNVSQITQIPWSSDLVNSAQTLLFESIGENVNKVWKDNGKKEPVKRQSQVGEGGMYI